MQPASSRQARRPTGLWSVSGCANSAGVMLGKKRTEMDDEAARLVDTLLRSGAAWKATALQQSMSIATIVLSAAMAAFAARC